MPILKLHEKADACGIPFTPGQSVREILDATETRVRSGCNGNGACGLCKIRIEEGGVHGPTAKELYLLDENRRARGVRLACQVVPEGDIAIEILSPARKSAWRSLSADQVYRTRNDYVVPGSEYGNTYGIAVDLGTTQISLSLLSMESGKRIASRCGRNPQGEAGTDVMTRLVTAAGSMAKAGKMSDQVITAIGEGIQDVAIREGIDLGKVSQFSLAGNTAMLALLTGRNYSLLVNPKTWMETIDCMPEDTSAWKAAWGIPSDSKVEVLPPAGGFVGSDLLSGVLATGLTESMRPGLLIDFGTNSEIALWDGKVLFATSAAGGPAFEGCGIRCGMPADPGAICQVRFTDSVPEYQMIAGEEARGLCGTGLVDLIAGLVRTGILNEKGQFAPAYAAANGFVLAGGDPALILAKSDVDIFQRAKAAVGAGVQILMDKAGIRYPDLDWVHVGGTFGKSLNTCNAAEIGLLPPIPPDRIELCGNTSLAGCELALLSQPASVRFRSIREDVRVINLANHRDFDDIYLENLYLRPMGER